MNQYDQQAQDFLTQTETTIKKEFVKYDAYFSDDKEKRNIWSITMTNKYGSYTFIYGDSIKNSAQYTVIDMQNKYAKDKYEKIVYASNKHNDKIMASIGNIKHDNKFLWSIVPIGVFFTPKKENFIEIEPSDYSILACLTILCDDNFNDFCDSYGYNTDSIRAKETYNNCVEQDRNIRKIFDRKEIEQLQEIQ